MHAPPGGCQQRLGKLGTGGIVFDDVKLDAYTVLRRTQGRKEFWKKIATMGEEQNTVACTVDDFGNEINPSQEPG